MDKIITLCWDCRDLVKEFYRVDVYDGQNAKPDAKCENCGKTFGLSVCRVRSK